MLAFDLMDQQGTATSLLIPLELPFMISREVSRRPLTITLLEAPNNHQMVLNNPKPATSHLGGGNHQE
jgi:hypothetical protein